MTDELSPRLQAIEDRLAIIELEGSVLPALVRYERVDGEWLYADKVTTVFSGRTAHRRLPRLSPYANEPGPCDPGSFAVAIGVS